MGILAVYSGYRGSLPVLGSWELMGADGPLSAAPRSPPHHHRPKCSGPFSSSLSSFPCSSVSPACQALPHGPPPPLCAKSVERARAQPDVSGRAPRRPTPGTRLPHRSALPHTPAAFFTWAINHESGEWITACSGNSQLLLQAPTDLSPTREKERNEGRKEEKLVGPIIGFPPRL